MISLRELLSKPPDPATYLVGPELLPKGGKLFLAAAEKTGKSFLLLNAALDMAAGRLLWGAFPIPKPLRVLYLDKELGYSRLRKRLISMSHEGIENIFLESKNIDAVLTDKGHKVIIKLVQEAKADVVIYDPLVKFYPGFDENSTAHMSIAMHHLDVVMKTTGSTTIVAHHLAKPGQVARRGAQRMRGSTALAADLDTYIEALRIDADHHKSRLINLSFVTRDEPVEDQYLKISEAGKVEYLGLENPMKRGGGRPAKEW